MASTGIGPYTVSSANYSSGGSAGGGFTGGGGAPIPDGWLVTQLAPAGANSMVIRLLGVAVPNIGDSFVITTVTIDVFGNITLIQTTYTITGVTALDGTNPQQYLITFTPVLVTPVAAGTSIPLNIITSTGGT